MIVEELKRLKGNNYSIVVNNESYIFDEEIILKYRLVKGKEVTKEILEEAREKNSIMEFYHKAMDYSIRYNKGRGQTVSYLIDKGLASVEANKIADRLVQNKIIDDKALVDGHIASLLRRKYGRLYIKEKLKEQGFSNDLIADALININMDTYYENMNILYNEALKRYKGEPYIIRAKAKKYVLSKGYSYEDLSNLL